MRNLQIDAIFLTKDSKNKGKTTAEKKAYNDLIQTSKFQQKVLIATSFMDNGINIEDKLVKHVIIDEENETEFIQMLGRIRINPEWKCHYITLYLEHKNVDMITKHFDETIMEHLQFIVTFQLLKNSKYRLSKNDLNRVRTKRKKNIICEGKFIDEYAKFVRLNDYEAEYAHELDFITQKYEINPFMSSFRIASAAVIFPSCHFGTTALKPVPY